MVVLEQSSNTKQEQITTMSNSKRKKSSAVATPPILSEQYLDGNKSKNDLVHRLQNVLEALSDENVEPSTCSGLDGLASRLVDDSLLHHKDKEVRLYTVLACLEIFAIYAPEPPFDPEEVFDIFSQVVAQLGNLSHTTLETQPNYHNYFSILEHLSQVRTGIVLVEYCRGYSGSPAAAEDDDEDVVVAQRALELLTDLIRIILESCQNEHSSEVRQHATTAIASCIGEFQHTIPICVLDVLLSCVSKGPKVWIHPAVRQQLNGEITALSTHRKRTPTTSSTTTITQLEKIDNISYRIAAKVIEITKDKCSTPIASLLNGILNGDSFALSHSSISAEDHHHKDKNDGGKMRLGSTAAAAHEDIPNVWSIVYEMHRIAPDILTTVIGTIASKLRSEEKDMRLRVVKLLGKLFYSPTNRSMIALRFLSCYKEWCQRSKDMDIEIRSTVLSCIIKTLETYASENSSKELRDISTTALKEIVASDPDANIRDLAIQQICELCLTRPEIIPPSLLRAVGDRVKAKNTSKAERKDALTGLAQLYHIHYLQKKLGPAEQYMENDVNKIDNVKSISGILFTSAAATTRAAKTQQLSKRKINGIVQKGEEEVSLYYRTPAQIEEQFYWIPEIVMESAWYTDQIDSDMRNRVIQIVDDILLGPSTTNKTSEGVTNAENGGGLIQPLSAVSRALGLALMINSLADVEDRHDVEETNAYKWLASLLKQRSSLQAAISAYIDARALIKNHAVDSVEAMKANSVAFSALEKVTTLTPTPTNEKDKLLQSLHGARDRHLFRVLATIATPMHSKTSRVRAFQDLPLRAKQCSFSKSEIAWLKTCARRCAMGAIDIELTEQLILLVRLCVDDAPTKSNMCNAISFMRALKLISNAFPKMASSAGLSQLQESFLAIQRTQGRRSKELETTNILSNLLLEVIASAVPHHDGTLDQEFEKELVKMCTHDQFGLMRLAIKILSSSSDRFDELLKIYSSNIYTLSCGDKRLTTVLTGLSLLSEYFPYRWRESTGAKIDKIIDFVLRKILLLENLDDHWDEERATKSTPNSRTSGSTRPSKNCSKAEDIASTICASIELLCSHVRSIHVGVLESRPIFKKEGQIIQNILKIAQNGGTHDAWSSSSNTVFRSTPKTSSQIRCIASLSLFRMIGDVALKLEDKYPSIELWHTIANSLLDEESAVRSVLIKEWIQAVSGSRKYCHGKKFAPSLRFLAMGVYCVDSENSYPMANGFAGNVHSICASAKETALQCVLALRKTCQIVEAQCAALGVKGELNFERRLKMKIMPEFTVPFFFHLLSHRPETPTIYPSDEVDDESFGAKLDEDVAAVGNDKGGDFSSKDNMKARCRQLRKRLTSLFEPLVLSLGDCGDNISFLLRMSELLGKHFQPVLASAAFDCSDASKRLGVVCRAARDVLLKFVKKDADLSHYAGPIQIPTTLFVRKSSISTYSDIQRQPLDRVRVSFADGMQSKITGDYEENQLCAGFEEELTEAFPKPLMSEKTILKLPPQSKENQENLLSPTLTSTRRKSSFVSMANSTDSSGKKPFSSKESSSVNLSTPPEYEDWGMSPIASSVSPHNTNCSLVESSFDSANDKSLSSRCIGKEQTPLEENWDESPTVTSITPHEYPSSLTPILRCSVKKQSSSSSKKLSVSFFSSETASGDKKTTKADVLTTPMSDISDDNGTKVRGKKGKLTRSKKPVVMMMPSALSNASKQSTSTNSRTRSSSRGSPSSKSPMIDESDFDFNDPDRFENVSIGKPLMKRKSYVGGKNKKSASATPEDVKLDSSPPSKRARRGKKTDDQVTAVGKNGRSLDETKNTPKEDEYNPLPHTKLTLRTNKVDDKATAGGKTFMMMPSALSNASIQSTSTNSRTARSSRGSRSSKSLMVDQSELYFNDPVAFEIVSNRKPPMKRKSIDGGKNKKSAFATPEEVKLDPSPPSKRARRGKVTAVGKNGTSLHETKSTPKEAEYDPLPPTKLTRRTNIVDDKVTAGRKTSSSSHATKEKTDITKGIMSSSRTLRKR